MTDTDTEDPPIACTLGVGDYAARLDAMRQVGADALIHSRIDGPRAELRFAAGAGVHERVAEIVDAEARCCAFLTMVVRDAPDAIVLTIEGPDDAASLIAELVDAFRGQAGGHG